jgi:AcrR family transcriptional regulator
VLVEVGNRLVTHDEATIRIPEICEATGVNYGSVYHHFGSREAVIDAAYDYLLTSIVTAEIEMLNLMNLVPAYGLVALMLDEIALNYSESVVRSQNRRIRMRVFAAAVTRPMLAERVAPLQSELFEATVATVARAQASGVICHDLSPRALTLFIQAMLFGRIMEDVIGQPVDSDEWSAFVRRIAPAFINPASQYESSAPDDHSTS